MYERSVHANNHASLRQPCSHAAKDSLARPRLPQVTAPWLVQQHNTGCSIMIPKATHQRSMLAGGMDSLERFAARQIKRRGLKDNFYAVDLGRLHALYQVRRLALPPCALHLEHGR
jgi:hypothetical protein